MPSVDYLSMSTDDLRALLAHYRQCLIVFPRLHSSRRGNFPIDVQRCRDQIREIELVLQGRSPSRAQLRGPLREFKVYGQGSGEKAMSGPKKS
jgi:hypothetical protein